MTPTMKTTTSSSGCGCGCEGTGSSQGQTARSGFAERPRFFPRQLITPDDLTLGQEYLRNKIRRHNRYLVGWGVVCGARVVKSADNLPWKVVVKTGYILGPYGDEILIDRDRCFDLRTKCITGVTGDVCSSTEVPDPFCTGNQTPTPAGPIYIAVKYQESMARPVRVQPAGCGCDDSSCEYSRWQDGYQICVLDACPDSHQNPPSLDEIGKPHGIPDCPPCPTDPWVVLARVTVDANGLVQVIDNCSCRRMVISFAPYWTRCNDAPIGTSPTAPTPAPTPTPTPGPAPAPAPGASGSPIR
jgi:hypothetical protein